MSTVTECTNCQKRFPVKNHLKYRVQLNLSFIKLALRNAALPWIGGLEEIYKPHLVVCPQCGKEFSSIGYKYFGFIEVKHFQIGLIVLFLLFVFSFLALMIWRAVE